MRCRRQLLNEVLGTAALRKQWELGAFCATAYTFGLRVPSEVFRQAMAAKFEMSASKLIYGPIQRKGKSGLHTLTRKCTCNFGAHTCLHLWLEIMRQARPSRPLFRATLNELMAQFVTVLRGLGVKQWDKFTSHCFRRGAGVDVLEAHGLQAMLCFGQWSSPQAASSYASMDEQTAQALGETVADMSEDD